MASKKPFVIDQADEITEKAAFTWRTNMSVRCRSQTGEEKSRLMGFGGGDSQASLGPTPRDRLPDDAMAYYALPIRRPIPALLRSPADLGGWGQKHHRVKIGFWPSIQPPDVAWYNEVRARDLARWRAVGIADAIDLCLQIPGGLNRAPLAAAFCLWNTASNTFDFRFGQMSISLLDILAITGLPIHAAPYVQGQFDDEKFPLQMTQTGRSIHSRSFPSWRNYYRGHHDETGGIAFLEWWLCKFIFCTSAGKPTGTWSSLATALYNGTVVGLGQPVLGSLYRALYQVAMHPFEVQSSGPFWILDFWLQTYFPHFRRPNVPAVPPNDVLLGRWLCREGRYESPAFSECFSFFYLLDEMPDVKLVVNRRFPAILANGFLPRPGHREEAMMMFRRTISCSDIQLATDELSYELYAPNHFARQFGLAQLVPWPLVDSANYYTSWRRSAPPGSAPFQSQFTLIVIPPWVRALYPLNDVDDDYADWWKEVSVNCWGMNNYDLFAILFRDLEHPFAVDSDILEQYYAGEAPPPVPAPPQHQPVPPSQPQRPSRQAQPGIQIREQWASVSFQLPSPFLFLGLSINPYC